MGKEKKKDTKKRVKESCCRKYIRKGKHCKNCPTFHQCDLPGTVTDSGPA